MAKHSKGNGGKKRWGEGLPQNYDELPKPGPDDRLPESIFGFIDRIERLQRKVEGKPADKVTIIRDDVLVNLFETAANYQFINKGDRLKTLFQNVESGMTNSQLAEELDNIKEKAEHKKQKIVSEITQPRPM